MTFLVCFIAYLLVGVAFFKIWWWGKMSRNDKDHNGNDMNDHYWWYAVSIITLWPVMVYAQISGFITGIRSR